MCAKLLQSCPILCDPMDCTLPGSSVHEIFQARIPEWGTISYVQGIFPTQGSNLHLLCLLHWQMGSLPLTPPGKPTTTFHKLSWKVKNTVCWPASYRRLSFLAVCVVKLNLLVPNKITSSEAWRVFHRIKINEHYLVRLKGYSLNSC